MGRVLGAGGEVRRGVTELVGPRADADTFPSSCPGAHYQPRADGLGNKPVARVPHVPSYGCAADRPGPEPAQHTGLGVAGADRGAVRRTDPEALMAMARPPHETEEIRRGAVGTIRPPTSLPVPVPPSEPVSPPAVPPPTAAATPAPVNGAPPAPPPPRLPEVLPDPSKDTEEVAAHVEPVPTPATAGGVGGGGPVLIGGGGGAAPVALAATAPAAGAPTIRPELIIAAAAVGAVLLVALGGGRSRAR